MSAIWKSWSPACRPAGARLIWASTTLAPAGEGGRWVGDDKNYNPIAARVMERHGIPTDDLYAATLGFAGKFSSRPGNVHYSREVANGSQNRWRTRSRRPWPANNMLHDISKRAQGDPARRHTRARLKFG